MSKPRRAHMRPVAKPILSRPADATVIAYLHAGQTSAHFTHSLLNLVMYEQVAGGRHVVNVIQQQSSANISSSRNDLTAKFLDESDADWLLWIDSDMAFEHDALERLLAHADPAGRPILGALCFGGTEGRLWPTIYRFMERPDGGISTIRVADYPTDHLVQCAATGAAFLLIHRDVLTKMRGENFNVAFPWFQETELGGEPAGEDVTFCIRAAIVGYPIHVDTTVKIGHHKTTILDEPMFLAQREALTGDAS